MVRRSFSVFRILGIVYALIGGIFAAVGVGFLIFSNGGEPRLLGFIFSLIGGVFLALGVVFLAVENTREKRIRELIAGQRYIWAEVVDITPNYQVRINGRSPVVITARYTDSRGEHLFRSQNINYYRDERLLGKQVRIYIRDESFRPYHMDAEPILPHVIEY